MARKKPTKFRIARIVVALDVSPRGRCCLEIGAELAESLAVELQGLYVEDVNLLNLARLPFARELIFASQQEQQLSVDEMQRRLCREAEQARAAMSRMAALRHVSCTFQVLRGQVAANLLSVAKEGDLVIVGQAAMLSNLRVGLGSTAKRIASQAPCSVLIVADSYNGACPVVCFFDGSDSAWHALTMAARLAQVDAHRLTVVVVWPDGQQTRDLSQALTAALKGYDLEVSYRYLYKRNEQAAIEALVDARGRVLVVNADNPLFAPEKLQTWLAKVRCSILLAR